MKKWIVSMGLLLVVVASCTQKNKAGTLTFLNSPLYPPFAYRENGELKGFEIDLAYEIGKRLDHKVSFQTMQFNAIIPAISSGVGDLAISSIGITPERAKQVDFSVPYYTESHAIVFRKDAPISNEAAFSNKVIAAQVGSTPHLWLEKHMPYVKIFLVDSNPQGIEAIKSQQADGLLIHETTAINFINKNPSLNYVALNSGEISVGLVFKKGSPYKPKVDQVLRTLATNGFLQSLKAKYLQTKE